MDFKMADSTMHASINQFPSYENFLDHVKGEIREAQPDLDLVYTDIPKAWVEDAWLFIENNLEDRTIRKSYNSITGIFWLRIMPTQIHNCHQRWNDRCRGRWLSSGLLTMPEWDYLNYEVGTTLIFRNGPYNGSRKEPDLFVTPDNRQLPTLVMESGWSESFTQLLHDMKLLLVGGNGEIRTIFIINWVKHNDNIHVNGFINVYVLDQNGMPIQRGPTEVIFPRPANSQNQAIRVTRRQLFGGTAPFANRNPNDIFEYRLDLLRDVATEALTSMGLTPA